MEQNRIISVAEQKKKQVLAVVRNLMEEYVKITERYIFVSNTENMYVYFIFIIMVKAGNSIGKLAARKIYFSIPLS